MIPRLATPGDAPRMAAIYNEGIEDRVATFETRPRSAEDARGWFDGRHPIVVVEQDGEIVAFASTSTYRPRECYSGIAEVSVYVGREFRGHGAGRIALDELVKEAKERGFWKLVSRVFPENPGQPRIDCVAGISRSRRLRKARNVGRSMARCGHCRAPSVSLRRCSQWRGSRGKNRE
jgi:L-amino acid N-acyltransferase YncA